jgi:FtsP/CotA-like multicopper oxidase with cupredoxin domain
MMRWLCIAGAACTDAPPARVVVPQPAPAATFASPAEAVDSDPAATAIAVKLLAAAHTYVVAGESVEGYAYNGQVPGPTIRGKVGDMLTVALENDLPWDTTIHWHGLKVPYAMDGVTWTSDPIAPGGRFTYVFELTHAGTFWYHPHFDTERQVDLGLYGVLIVEDPAEPTADYELVMVADAWGEYFDPEDDAAGHRHEHAGGHLAWTLNGWSTPTLDLPRGARVRTRWVNVSNAGYLHLRWPGMRLIATDQGLLSGLQEPQSVLLTSGDRAEFEWVVLDDFAVEQLPFSIFGEVTYGTGHHGGEVEAAEQEIGALARIRGTGSGVGEPLAWPFAARSISPDPAHTDLTYAFQGDAHANVWLINGEEFPAVTAQRLAPGSDVTVEVRNLSGSEHPFHLHGHHVEVLSVNGIASTVPTLEDTINLPIRSWTRLRLVADNPGSWMLHCHILSHAHRGMMTVLQVE